MTVYIYHIIGNTLVQDDILLAILIAECLIDGIVLAGKLIGTMTLPGIAPSTVQVSLDANGIPCYDIKEGAAWDNIPYTPALEKLAENCTAACFGSLAQRNEVSRNTIYRFLDHMPKGEEILKIFDINLRQGFYDKDIITESIKRCNILKINDEELITVSRIFGYPGIDLENKCWLLLGKYNLKMLILTCGVNGSYVGSRVDWT